MSEVFTAEGWVQFSHRLGRGDPIAVWHRGHFRGRHNAEHHRGRTTEATCVISGSADIRRRCQCSGTFSAEPGVSQCCAPMTQEDLRCDECRRWCVYARYDPAEIRPIPLV